MHVSDGSISNIHTLINECRKLDNAKQVLILPQQIIREKNVELYLKEASDGFPFVYYHYPEKYGYKDVNVSVLQKTIPNMKGAKIVEDSSQFFGFKNQEHVYVSGEHIKKDGFWKSTFVEEYLIDYLGTDMYYDINCELKANRKEKSRLLIKKLYNIDLGPSRAFKYNTQSYDVSKILSIMSS